MRLHVCIASMHAYMHACVLDHVCMQSIPRSLHSTDGFEFIQNETGEGRSVQDNSQPTQLDCKCAEQTQYLQASWEAVRSMATLQWAFLSDIYIYS